MLLPARLAALVALLVAAVASFALAPSIALAADTIPDSAIPDANLRTKLKSLTVTPPDQEIPVSAANARTTVPAGYAGPVDDLKGLELFPNLTSLVVSYTGKRGAYTDLTPIAGLTKLTTLDLRNGSVSDLTPLSGLTNLTSLTLSDQRISDLTKLPNLPKATLLTLSTNQIADVTPLLDKQLSPATLTTLGLSANRIVDAAPLATLGAGTNKLGTTGNINVAGNRIKDLSVFSTWTKKPTAVQTQNQTIYAGTYQPGGVTVPLKTLARTPATLAAGAPGTYDAETGKLTLTGTEPVESVAITPSWTVAFTPAPDAPDPAAPTIDPYNWPGVDVQVTDDGTWKDGLDCPELEYQWFRDGEAIQAVRLPDLMRPMPASQPVLGDGGNFKAYKVQAFDVGKRLTARVSCKGTPIFARSAPTAIVAPEEVGRPVIQALEGTTVLDSWNGNFLSKARSGVYGDPTNPKLRFFVAAVDADGVPIPPAQLTVTATWTSNWQNVYRPEDIVIEGTGNERTLTLNPQIGEASAITLTVTAPSGKTDKLSFSYAMSKATTPTSRVLMGISDPSTAIAVGGGHLLVADDEKSPIRLYDSSVSGREVADFSIHDTQSEIDFESSARKGDTIYWLGSHGNDKSARIQPSRQVVFASTLTGTGAGAKLAPKGVPYRGLRADLVAWDQENSSRFGFAAGTAAGKYPDSHDGFNIEGAEFSPDGSELYLGFRSPVVPAAADGKALIVPVKNIEELTAGTANKAVFGEPIQLDLGGQSIREIRKNAANEYLIVGARAGNVAPVPGADTQALWVWNGQPGTAPIKLAGTAIDRDRETSNGIGGWEGIGEVPAQLTQGAKLRLIMDQGYDKLYGNTENKDDTNQWTRKARTDEVALSAPASTTFATSDPVVFPAQATNTVGAPRSVRVTNSGFTTLNLVQPGRIRVVDEDGVSRDEFLITSDDCAGEVLVVGESCDVRVRFAPSRTNATSSAKLEIAGNLPGGKTTVALTGTSTELPKGDKGDTGEEGGKGDTGDAGPKGDQGAKGDAGADGPRGDTGLTGPIGLTGPAGTSGSAGPKGETGATGAQGPAGPVTVSAPSSSGQPTIRVDKHGRLVVTVRNASAAAVRLRVRATAKVNGRTVVLSTRTVRVAGGRNAKVTLAVSRGARRKLGKAAHPLTVTATPLTGANRRATTLTARVDAR